MSKMYCAKAWYSGGEYGAVNEFEYTMVECDSNEEQERICMKKPNDCSAQSERKKRNAEVASLDIYFKDQESSKVKMENDANQQKKAFKESFKKMNSDINYRALFELLWYTQLPCFDVENVTSEYKDQYGMLKGCIWKGVDMPCSKVFEMVPTDQGMCCAFNLNKAEEMFKDGNFREMVQKMQQRDMNLSFDRVPSSLNENIDLTPEAGLSKGLQVILDAHSNLLAGGSVPGDFDGFYAIIESKDQYPMTSRKSILLRPGDNNYVSLTATKITSEGIIDIEPKKRNCLSPEDEPEMKVHRIYTQANCMLECHHGYALSQVTFKKLFQSNLELMSHNFAIFFT